MATWYRVALNQIDPVEVIKETKSTVTYQESYLRFFGGFDSELRAIGTPSTAVRSVSRPKYGKYECFFETWEVAHAHLRHQITEKLEDAEREVKSHQETLRRISEMRP